jgi:hypothetical protein
MNALQIGVHVNNILDAARRDAPEPPLADIAALATQALVDLNRIATALEALANLREECAA